MHKEYLKKILSIEDDREEVVVFVHKHWYTEFIAWMSLLVGALLPIAIWTGLNSFVPQFYLDFIRGSPLVLVFGIYYLFLILLIFVYWLDEYADMTVVTNKRVIDIHQTGLFKREREEIVLAEIQNVSATTSSFFGSLLGFGHILIESAGESGNLVINNAPRPFEIQAKIMKLKEDLDKIVPVV